MAYTHLSIRTKTISKRYQKRYQHLPKGSQCDCWITKCSGQSVPGSGPEVLKEHGPRVTVRVRGMSSWWSSDDCSRGRPWTIATRTQRRSSSPVPNGEDIYTSTGTTCRWPIVESWASAAGCAWQMKRELDLVAAARAELLLEEQIEVETSDWLVV